jgi:hypothetical protein
MNESQVAELSVTRAGAAHEKTSLFHPHVFTGKKCGLCQHLRFINYA